jgi:hypothetical protein
VSILSWFGGEFQVFLIAFSRVDHPLCRLGLLVSSHEHQSSVTVLSFLVTNFFVIPGCTNVWFAGVTAWVRHSLQDPHRSLALRLRLPPPQTWKSQNTACTSPSRYNPCADLPSLYNLFSRSRTPSPEPTLTPFLLPSVPRRMVALVVGLKPYCVGP